MVATRTTVNDILKEVYDDLIRDQLNEEAYLFDHFENRQREWAGRNWNIPVKVGRNSGVGWRAESATLPTAGSQGYDNLVVTPAYFYGVFRVTRPMMKSLAEGGDYSFGSYMETEVDGLYDDILNQLNQDVVTGGRVVGFLREKQASTSTAGNGHDLANAGEDVWVFDGDFAKLDSGPSGAIVRATPGTWVRIDLINLRGYEEGGAVGASQDYTDGGYEASSADHELYIIDHDEDAGTIEIAVTTVAGGAGVHFSTLDADFADMLDHSWAVVLHQTAGAGGQIIDITTQNNEMQGIFANLCEGTHFTLDRSITGGATNGTQLQARCIVAGGAGNARSQMARGDYDNTIAKIKNRAGRKPNCYWKNELQMQVYKSNILLGLAGATWALPGERPTRGDGGFKDDGISHDGRPMKSSQHLPNGIVFLENSETWEQVVLGDGEWVEDDGHILKWVDQTDQFEGYWALYCNLVCNFPAANGIVSGFTLEA